MQTMNMLTGAPETRNPQKANFERQFHLCIKENFILHKSIQHPLCVIVKHMAPYAPWKIAPYGIVL